MCMPHLPSKVEGCYPTRHNLYTDGGLANPYKQDFAIGGYGIFCPTNENIDKVATIQQQPSLFSNQPWDPANDITFEHLKENPVIEGCNRYM